MLKRTLMIAALVAVTATPFSQSNAAEDDPVVATVNGQNILRSEIEAARQFVPQQYRNLPMNVLYPTLLNTLIDQRLAFEDAKRQKLDKSEDYIENMKRLSRQVLQNAVFNDVATKAITEDKLKASYAEFLKTFKAGEELNARHILVKSEDEAKAIIKELSAGADFAELAKKKSTGPSAPNGGDLGYFKNGQMVKEFEAAAKALKKGEFTKAPVKTQFGWHVIKLEDRRDAQPPTLQEKTQELSSVLAQAAVAKYSKELRENAKVTSFNLDGTPLDTKPIDQKKAE